MSSTIVPYIGGEVLKMTQNHNHGYPTPDNIGDIPKGSLEATVSAAPAVNISDIVDELKQELQEAIDNGIVTGDPPRRVEYSQETIDLMMDALDEMKSATTVEEQQRLLVEVLALSNGATNDSPIYQLDAYKKLLDHPQLNIGDDPLFQKGSFSDIADINPTNSDEAVMIGPLEISDEAQLFYGGEQVTLAQKTIGDGSVTFLALGENGIITDENIPIEIELDWDEIRTLNNEMLDVGSDEFVSVVENITDLDGQKTAPQQDLTNNASFNMVLS